jgi:hypothetical protein
VKFTEEMINSPNFNQMIQMEMERRRQRGVEGPADERRDWMGAPTKAGHLNRLFEMLERDNSPRTERAILKAIANVSRW